MNNKEKPNIERVSELTEEEINQRAEAAKIEKERKFMIESLQMLIETIPEEEIDKFLEKIKEYRESHE